MKKLNLLILPLFASLLFACNFAKAPIKNSKEAVYFDLKHYFEEEAQRLNDSKELKVSKTIVQNQQREQKEQKIEDWNTELLLFSQADFNKISFAGFYTVDSTKNQFNKLEKITFKAQKGNLDTQELVINFDDAENISSLSIQILTHNNIFNTQYLLAYAPATGYVIQKKQTVLFYAEDQFSIIVNFINS